jgi:hypothetical protein
VLCGDDGGGTLASILVVVNAGEPIHLTAQRRNGLLRFARNDGANFSDPISVMAGLVPAIHVLQYFGMGLFETSTK